MNSDLQNQVLAGFDQVIARHCAAENIADPALVVGFSGGLDSHVLLVVASLWCAAHPGAALRAVTIDHGLQKDSALWSEHCAGVCKRLGVAFEGLTVDVDTGSGLSPEEAARNARYQALTSSLSAGEFLLTAHHADDQAETVLLQLLRGAGVRGLAAMPEKRSRGCGFQVRPFLSVTRESLYELACLLDLQWIEDPSNKDERFDRNFLRSSIMPLLRERWPSMAVNLARSASHCSKAALLNRELAGVDLGAASNEQVLPLSTLEGLDHLRRKNALRVWVERHGYQPPSTAQLERIDADLVCGSAESAGHVSFGRAQIRRYSAQLYLAQRSCFEDVPSFFYEWSSRRKDLIISETGQVLGAADLDLPWLPDDQLLIVRNRVGGERIRLQGHKNSTSVKALLQQNRIPPWQRNRLPLIYWNDCLIGIAGIGFSGKPAIFP